MKKCKSGYYYCNTDKKCKPIPRGYRVGYGGYLRKEKDDDDSKTKSNGNGNGNGNGSNGNGNGGNGSGGNGGGGNGGGMGEEVTYEAKMTEKEKKKKEEIVMSMKKKKKEFKDRYGEDGESVMYATATKLAMEGKDPKLTKIVKQLRNSVKKHQQQSDYIEKINEEEINVGQMIKDRFKEKGLMGFIKKPEKKEKTTVRDLLNKIKTGLDTQKEESNPRIPRKKGQPANSKKHSDLYTDENPKGTIHGLGFKDVATAKASVSKIRGSSRSHAHKIQAAVAMEQRAREMGKSAEAAIYRKFINSMKKKTEKMNEGSLHKWFKGSKSKDGKGGWVNVVTGGTCASDEPGEGTPKCVSSSKRASMTKAERLSAARRKKKADPGQQSKSGAAKPTYVSTDSPRKKKKMKEETVISEEGKSLFSTPGLDKLKKLKDYKSNADKVFKRKETDKAHYEPEGEIISEVKDKKGKGSGSKDACYHKVKSRYSVWPSAYASGALVKCRKVGAANWGNSRKEEVEYEVNEQMTDKQFMDTKIKMQSGKYTASQDEQDAYVKEVNRRRVNTSPHTFKINYKTDKTNTEHYDLSFQQFMEKCWKGYEKKGMKTMFGKRYPNCVKKEETVIEHHTKDENGKVIEHDLPPRPEEEVAQDLTPSSVEEGAAWTKKSGKNPSGGLNEKGRKSYERENPGSDLKRPSKKVGNKRRASFCARMRGMKKKLTSAKTARDPDSRINKSLRAWNC